MSRRSALGGGGGSFIGDLKLKVLTNLGLTFETANGQEWLRAGWTVPWDGKYSASHADYGRGMFGYSTAPVVGASDANARNGGLIAGAYWDGTRFILHNDTQASTTGAAAITTFTSPGGATIVQDHATVSGTAGHYVTDVAVATNGRQVAACTNYGGSGSVRQRDGLSSWSTRTPPLNFGFVKAAVGCNPSGTQWLFSSDTPASGSSVAYSTDGFNWTVRSPTGPGVGSAGFLKICWSQRLGRFLCFYNATSAPPATTADAGVTFTYETLPGGGTFQAVGGASFFAESPTAVMFLGRDSSNARCFYRSTGGAWSAVSFPAGLPNDVVNIVFAGGSFWLQYRGGLWRSPDDGLTFVFQGYAIGHPASSFDWLGAANGQMFRAVNASVTQIEYFLQPTPAGNPERVGHRFPIVTNYGGANDFSHGFVRIF